MLDTSKQATRQSTQTAKAEPAKGPDWLLIAAFAALAMIVAAIAWDIATQSDDTAQVQGQVSGFEYNTDATTGQSASAGVTSQYFGNSGELFPETSQVSGFDNNTDATAGRSVKPGVTTTYFGNSGELFPEEAPQPEIQYNPYNPDSNVLAEEPAPSVVQYFPYVLPAEGAPGSESQQNPGNPDSDVLNDEPAQSVVQYFPYVLPAEGAPGSESQQNPRNPDRNR